MSFMLMSMPVGKTKIQISRLLLVAFVNLMLVGNLIAEKQPPVSATLVTDAFQVDPGGKFNIGVAFKIQPGWHVYYKNPGETGLPTSVQVTVSDGGMVGEQFWPVPVRFVAAGDIVGYGYSDELLLWFPAQFSADSRYGDVVKFDMNVGWLACSHSLCLPGRAQLSREVVVGKTAKEENTGIFREWSKRLPTQVNKSAAIDSVETNVSKKGKDFTLELKVKWSQPMELVNWIPDGVEGLIFAQPKRVTKGLVDEVFLAARTMEGVGFSGEAIKGLLTFAPSSKSNPQGVFVDFELP